MSKTSQRSVSSAAIIGMEADCSEKEPDLQEAAQEPIPIGRSAAFTPLHRTIGQEGHAISDRLLFCTVKRRKRRAPAYWDRLFVKAILGKRSQIGNNRGRSNGWIGENRIARKGVRSE